MLQWLALLFQQSSGPKIRRPFFKPVLFSCLTLFLVKNIHVYEMKCGYLRFGTDKNMVFDVMRPCCLA